MAPEVELDAGGMRREVFERSSAGLAASPPRIGPFSSSPESSSAGAELPTTDVFPSAHKEQMEKPELLWSKKSSCEAKHKVFLLDMHWIDRSAS